MGRRDILTPTPVFLKALYGGALYPDCNLTLKLTTGYMLRNAIERAMKKREAMTRE